MELQTNSKEHEVGICLLTFAFGTAFRNASVRWVCFGRVVKYTIGLVCVGMSSNVNTPYVALGSLSRVVLITSGPCCRTDLNASMNKIECAEVNKKAHKPSVRSLNCDTSSQGRSYKIRYNNLLRVLHNWHVGWDKRIWCVPVWVRYGNRRVCLRMRESTVLNSARRWIGLRGWWYLMISDVLASWLSQANVLTDRAEHQRSLRHSDPEMTQEDLILALMSVFRQIPNILRHENIYIFLRTFATCMGINLSPNAVNKATWGRVVLVIVGAMQLANRSKITARSAGGTPSVCVPAPAYEIQSCSHNKCKTYTSMCGHTHQVRRWYPRENSRSLRSAMATGLQVELLWHVSMR